MGLLLPPKSLGSRLHKIVDICRICFCNLQRLLEVLLSVVLLGACVVLWWDVGRLKGRHKYKTIIKEEALDNQKPCNCEICEKQRKNNI